MLYIDNCTSSSITFVIMKKLEEQSEWITTNRFEFDFRFYHPYSGPEMKKSGLYVFKTSDTDSTPLNHTISNI